MKENVEVLKYLNHNPLFSSTFFLTFDPVCFALPSPVKSCASPVASHLPHMELWHIEDLILWGLECFHVA